MLLNSYYSTLPSCLQRADMHPNAFFLALKSCRIIKESCFLQIVTGPTEWAVFDTNQLYIREREWRRVRVLSVKDLVLSFCPRLRAHVIFFYLDWKQPVSCSLPCFFLTRFHGKNPCFKRNNALYEWHPWRGRRLNYQLQNWPYKSGFRGDDFSSKFHYQRAVDNEFLPYVTLLSLWTMT